MTMYACLDLSIYCNRCAIPIFKKHMNLLNMKGSSIGKPLGSSLEQSLIPYPLD